MPAFTILSIGWPDSEPHELNALQLLSAEWEPIRSSERDLIVRNCEIVFRRRVNGFGDWKKFVGIATEIARQKKVNVLCQFDAFAFSFLESAKNADLLLPVRNDLAPESEAFCHEGVGFFEQLDSLQKMEGSGITPADSELIRRYLSARKVLSRASCRDERRVVATLFVNGPSTAHELATDLNMSEKLAERVLEMLRQSHCVTRRGGGRFCIDRASLAVCCFLIKETIGFSLHHIMERYIGCTANNA